MTRTKKATLRTCVACRLNTDKRELVRLVRTKDGEVFVDPSGRRDGRGAYVCAERGCFETAVEGRLSSALRARLTEEDIERLRDDFEAVLIARDSSHKGR